MLFSKQKTISMFTQQFAYTPTHLQAYTVSFVFICKTIHENKKHKFTHTTTLPQSFTNKMYIHMYAWRMFAYMWVGATGTQICQYKCAWSKCALAWIASSANVEFNFRLWTLVFAPAAHRHPRSAVRRPPTPAHTFCVQAAGQPGDR